MADITMCEGTNCSVKNKCHRHTAVINEYRQSYFTNIPGKDEKCDHFWDNDGWNDVITDAEEEESLITV